MRRVKLNRYSLEPWQVWALLAVLVAILCAGGAP